MEQNKEKDVCLRLSCPNKASSVLSIIQSASGYVLFSVTHCMERQTYYPQIKEHVLMKPCAKCLGYDQTEA